MTTRSEDSRYTAVAVYLHWMIALLILSNWPLGFYMETIPRPERMPLVGVHATIGATVFFLTVLRVLWRLTHSPPPLESALSTPVRFAAHTIHVMLYVLMLALPLTGWAIISANPPRPNGGVMAFGLTHFPSYAPLAQLERTTQHLVHDQFVDLHAAGGWLMFAAFALHIAGALKHQFVDRQRSFARMSLDLQRGGIQSPPSNP